MIRKIDGEFHSWLEFQIFGRVYRTRGYWKNLVSILAWDNVELKLELRDIREGVK